MNFAASNPWVCSRQFQGQLCVVLINFTFHMVPKYVEDGSLHVYRQVASPVTKKTRKPKYSKAILTFLPLLCFKSILILLFVYKLYPSYIITE